ncbi:MAG: hypothetical protein AAGD09_02735 [Cyanobacteria bacterium P01_F01_bin.56]
MALYLVNVLLVLEPGCCPHGHTANMVKNGKSAEGKQRYRCRHHDCSRASFIFDYIDRGHVPEVKDRVSELSMNGSGISDTARSWGLAPTW